MRSRPVCLKGFLGLTAAVAVICSLYGCDDSSAKSHSIQCEKNCDQVGGLPRVCVITEEGESCELACSGDKEGVNDAVCTQDGISLPAGSPYYSTIYSCSKDMFGTLYVTSAKRTECANGCDETSGLCIDDIPKECTKDCLLIDGPEQICVFIDGEETCKAPCNGNAEGVNAPYCSQGSGYLPPDAPYYSMVDTCSKDDFGTLYVTDQKSEECANGCVEKTGKCIDEPPKECTTNCILHDGPEQICVFIDGEETCKEPCNGNVEGVNAPYCSQGFGMIPPDAPYYSMIDTCTKDDFGTLYVTDRESDVCDGDCDEITGLCINDAPTGCTKNCVLDGGLPQVCVLIDGKETCELACMGDKVGVNDPVCTQDGSALPPGSPYYSTIYTCAEDELGTLYVTNQERTLCSGACNEDTGLCLVGSCDKSCPDQFCVLVNGKETCESPCGSSGEGIFNYCDGKLIAITETCELDDKGVLYASKSNVDYCGVSDKNCFIVDGNAVCKEKCHEGVYCRNDTDLVEEECKQDDNGDKYVTSSLLTPCGAMIGGETKICAQAGSSASCKSKCNVNASGVQAPYCYKNGSLGPMAPVYSRVNTCAEADNGTFYITDSTSEECSSGCDNSTGLCK